MKKIYTIAIALLVAATSFAQSGHRYSQVYSFNWQSSVPLGKLGRRLNTFSPCFAIMCRGEERTIR